jgi:hypothetical protein
MGELGCVQNEIFSGVVDVQMFASCVQRTTCLEFVQLCTQHIRIILYLLGDRLQLWSAEHLYA